jgi:hypothetical protein
MPNPSLTNLVAILGVSNLEVLYRPERVRNRCGVGAAAVDDDKSVYRN